MSVIATTQRFNPVSEPAPAAAPAPAAGIKKLNLAGFKKKTEDSSSSDDYPELPDPTGKAAETASAILKMQEEFEALDGALKTHKKFRVSVING